VLGIIVLTSVIVGVIIFLQPDQYLSVITAVPASSFSSDKSKIFSANIQELYSELGTEDDLDMIVGTAKLDTVYLAVTDQFNLFDHYKISEKGEAARHKAAKLFMHHCRVMKSEYGELKIKVWDTDKNLAPQLANAIFNNLQSIHQELQSINSRSSLIGLQKASTIIKFQIDSITANTKNGDEGIGPQIKGLTDQLQEYEKLISQYQLIIDSKPPVLLVVEKARASAWPDKPKRVLIIIVTAVLSFLFALLAAMVLERRKISKL